MKTAQHDSIVVYGTGHSPPDGWWYDRSKFDPFDPENRWDWCLGDDDDWLALVPTLDIEFDAAGLVAQIYRPRSIFPEGSTAGL